MSPGISPKTENGCCIDNTLNIKRVMTLTVFMAPLIDSCSIHGPINSCPKGRLTTMANIEDPEPTKLILYCAMLMFNGPGKVTF